MEPNSEGLRLTEANLKKLQPSLIRPMSPMSISSGDDDMVAELAADERIARLKSWVYNAMQTLVGLGSEGRGVVEADELYVAGPGDVRLRERAAEAEGQGTCEKQAGNRAGASDKAPGRQTHVRTAGKQPEIDTGADVRADAVPPDVSDPNYWETKLRYLEEKCQPLCQERRKRRRLAPAAEDKACARPPNDLRGRKTTVSAAELRPSLGIVDAAQAERSRIEQNKLLWLNKAEAVEAWIGNLPTIEPPKLPIPIPGCQPCLFEDNSILIGDECNNNNNNTENCPPSSDSSIIEITSTQFSHAVGGRQRAPGATAADVPQTTSAPAVSGSATQNTIAEDSGLEGTTTASPQSSEQRGRKRRRDQCSRASTLPMDSEPLEASEITAAPIADAVTMVRTTKEEGGYPAVAHLTSPPESQVR